MVTRDKYDNLLHNISHTHMPAPLDRSITADICELLSTGTPLAEICRDSSFPCVTTVGQWAKDDVELSDAIAHARIEGFDAIAARLRLTARGLDSEFGGESTGDTQRDKLIIDTDLKLLSKWDPKRYGDKIQTEITGAGGGPVALIAATLSPDQAAEAYRKMIEE